MVSYQGLMRTASTGFVAVWVFLGLAVSELGAKNNYFIVTGGLTKPVGRSTDFSDAGTNIELRVRHYNRGRSAYEFAAGYIQGPLGGVIISTIDDFELLTRRKNQLAQQQGGPGRGSVLAEYGILEIFYANANFIFRPMHRSRFSPIFSIGAGLYNWRVPFRVKFFEVPSFGEQRAWSPIEDGNTYAFIHEESVIDYSKRSNSGGLNAAIGGDLRFTQKIYFSAEARAHLIFSSGTGNREEGIDDQDYLDNMTFLLVNGGLNYRF